MLEDCPERLRVLEQRMIVALEVRVANGIGNHGVRLPRVLLNDRPRRPCRIAACNGDGLGLGVDAAREDRFEVLVDTPLSEPLLDQRIHRKCRQVPFVEDNRIPKRDRPVVIGRVADQVEERPGTGAAALGTFQDGGSI